MTDMIEYVIVTQDNIEEGLIVRCVVCKNPCVGMIYKKVNRDRAYRRLSGETGVHENHSLWEYTEYYHSTKNCLLAKKKTCYGWDDIFEWAEYTDNTSPKNNLYLLDTDDHDGRVQREKIIRDLNNRVYSLKKAIGDREGYDL